MTMLQIKCQWERHKIVQCSTKRMTTWVIHSTPPPPPGKGEGADIKRFRR